MKLFGEVNVLRGSVAWTRPFRLHVARENPPQPAPVPAALPEFDEDGRLYVFRYPAAAPQHYEIKRDRIFEYMRRRRLPDEGQRQIRRDECNRADFWEL
ncbi:MAG TPA: hypothetical protein VFN37_03095 [Candidatus Baltobacteraceae bacterium]|nr:hypothetical protein [Candidatus Baltobacteraceae bacterium]